MATYYAQATGNINDTNMWNSLAGGGGTPLSWPPAYDDILMANGKAITINVSFACQSINTTTASSSFIVATDVTIGTADHPTNIDAVNGIGLTCNHTYDSVVTIYGNVSTTGGTAFHGLVNSSTGTVTIYGNVASGNASAARGLANNSTGTINIYGSVTARRGMGVSNASTGVINIGSVAIPGSVTGGTYAAIYGMQNSGSGTVTIIGNVTGGSNTNSNGVYNGSTGTVNVVGNVTGGSGSGAAGMRHASTGIFNVTGNVTGGGTATSYGIHNVIATTNITGNAYASASTYAVFSNSGTITVTNGNIYNGNNMCAILGVTIYNPINSTNYVRCYKANRTTTVDFPLQLSAENIKSGTVSGAVTGSYKSAGGSSVLGSSIIKDQ